MPGCYQGDLRVLCGVGEKQEEGGNDQSRQRGEEMVAKAAGGFSCWTSGVPVVILVVCFMVTAVVGEYSVNASYNRTRDMK